MSTPALKQISPHAIPRALELAERYRLLNEPEQAESICHDVLAIDPGNQTATRMMLLAITDQFGHRKSATLTHAREVAAQLTGEYEKFYYSGVAMERWARCKHHEPHSENLVRDWLHNAMESFEKAEAVRPHDDDSAMLRWNSCQRLLNKLPQAVEVGQTVDYGD